MLNRKGQGLTEYGIILLLVVLIGTGVWFNTDFNSQDKSMYSTISLKLQSIIDDVTGTIAKTFDTNDVVFQKTRKSDSYATTLKMTINGKVYDILWRYENMKNMGTDKNKNFVPTADTTKVYYLALDDASSEYQVYWGSTGLMTAPYAAKLATANDNYSSYGGYISGTDGNGAYKATYFNIENTTYEIKDYGAGKQNSTILSEYTGDTSASVTNAATGKSDTIANMAAARTNYIETTGVSKIKAVPDK